MFNGVLSVALIVSIGLLVVGEALAQKFNYDEAQVPKYELPDALIAADGSKVTTASMWQSKRRAEVLAMMERHVYGKMPGKPPVMRVVIMEQNRKALGGKAIRKQIRVYFSGSDKGPQMNILIYLPAQAKQPVPTFVALNFRGNHSIHSDEKIIIPTSWMRPQKNVVVNNRATEKGRGIASSRWAVGMILSRGYGLATIYYGDIDPDYHDGFKNGVHPLFYKKGQVAPAADQWGSIGAWAWGLSRAMDYFESDRDIDQKQIAVMGHSRLGKTSLWAGATDERFALVISNNSGCGGAALSRRRFGETVKRINTAFPHWFCGNYKNFNDKELEAPVDQHMLIALMAPRPVYVASAEQDKWADPRGEFLSAKYASGVYRLLGNEGIAADQDMPAIHKPIMTSVGYHLRAGRHDVTDYDWARYLDFADKHFKSAKKSD